MGIEDKEKEPYQPIKEEILKAKGAMSEEERAQSAERERDIKQVYTSDGNLRYPIYIEGETVMMHEDVSPSRYTELSPNEALHRLDKEEKLIRHGIERSENRLIGLQELREKINKLKEKQP